MKQWLNHSFRFSPVLMSRIWIDLANSPHVPFFRALVPEFVARGHEVLVTAREFAQTLELAEEAGVSKGFVKESEHYDVPVARVKVDKVLEVLSKHHGRPITIADVKDLKVI